MAPMRFASDAICVASGLEESSFDRMLSVTPMRPSSRFSRPISYVFQFVLPAPLKIAAGRVQKRQKRKEMELEAARAVVAARRAATPTGPMPASAAPAPGLGPKLATYVLTHPNPDLTMLEGLLAMREREADTADVGLAIFNNLAPESLRMTRDEMLARAAQTVLAESERH